GPLLAPEFVGGLAMSGKESIERLISAWNELEGVGDTTKNQIENVADLARDEQPEVTLALDAAIGELEAEDAAAAAVVRLRFYAGLTGEQTAEVLGLSPRQVDREWVYARTFLLSRMRGARA
ncbi:MAG: hypothetical protein HUU27_13720, partial [Phycisphaerae bacterium]|nr:hypothetical protein [Phycisphaerae bacterium]